MAAPLVTVRCPACGEDLRVLLAPAPPTQWFPCPRCRTPVPVVVPRDPPPLYSWEVLPNLYPQLPAPRIPRIRPRRAAAWALLLTAFVAALLGGALAVYGVEAQASGSFTVSGTVLETPASGSTTPASGAHVILTTEQNRSSSEFVGPSGEFAFAGVPTGGFSLNVSLAGYAPVEVQSFVSTIYSAGSTGLTIDLTPGGLGNGTVVSLTAFSDLESLVASIDSGVVMLFLAAGVAGGAAAVTFRSDRPAIGVVGGGAGLLAPVALYLLALGTAFPWFLALSGILAALGAFTLALRTVELARFGSASRPESPGPPSPPAPPGPPTG